jgi:hypothetical protein
MTIAPLELLRRRPWRDMSIPADARVPGMLSELERTLLYSLARDYAPDDAVIVDAGCFLGGSTAPLLAGLRDRREPWRGPPMTSYDRFRVEAYTIPLFFADDPTVRVGDSFRGRFEARVAPFDVPHVVREGDVMEIGWSGEPIDILFLDLVKSWKINDAVLQDFFSCLVPGRSVIVQQDYGWGGEPWIAITMELLGDSVALIDGMKAGSHLFFVERPLPEGVIAGGVRRLSENEHLELMGRAVERAEGWVRGMLELSRAKLIANQEGREAALRAVAAVEARYSDPDVRSCLAYVRDSLETDPDSAAVRFASGIARAGAP